MTDFEEIEASIGKYLDEDSRQEANDRLFAALLKEAPEQTDAVLQSGCGDIDPEFIGFIAQYEVLSKLISLDATVIDFGCAYAPQAYIFRKHFKYIGVDVGPIAGRFSFANSEHHECKIQGWIAANAAVMASGPAFRRVDGKLQRADRIFAICSYVPDQEAQKLVRATYNNVFSYYP